MPSIHIAFRIALIIQKKNFVVKLQTFTLQKTRSYRGLEVLHGGHVACPEQ